MPGKEMKQFKQEDLTGADADQALRAKCTEEMVAFVDGIHAAAKWLESGDSSQGELISIDRQERCAAPYEKSTKNWLTFLPNSI